MGDLAIDLAIRLLLGGVVDENVDLAELLSGLFARRAGAEGFVATSLPP
jgi:hypothetical protein